MGDADEIASVIVVKVSPELLAKMRERPVELSGSLYTAASITVDGSGDMLTLTVVVDLPECRTFD